MTQPLDDRLLVALQNMIEAYVDVRMRYYRPWKYAVISATAGPPVKMDLSSLNTLMPNLTNVTLWPGPSGGNSVPVPGAVVTVTFENGDSTQPRVSGTDANNNPLEISLPAVTSLKLGAVPTGHLAFATPVTTSLADISTFILALQTVLTQMVAGYVTLTAGQITAWNAAVVAVNAAIVAQSALVPTIVVTAE